MRYPDVDYTEAQKVEALINRVRGAGLKEAADLFETVYWAWQRTVGAYVLAHPYVGKPEKGMTPISSLAVVDYTLRHWAPKVPGTPNLNDQAVLDAAEADEEWHRLEDRRMRRDAGEEI